MHWTVFQLVTLALSVSVSSSQELNNTLHLTEYGVPYAFVGETITFTCRTERSNSIGWSSKEYIGVNRVDFASVEPDGTTRPPTESGAIAQLISSSRVNGTVILVSQLRITVQSVYQIASVTCHNIGIDTVDTSSFRMADNTSITCDAPAICPGEKVSCACITAHSNRLAWSSDQLIGNGGAELAFNFNEPLPARQNASDMNTFAVLSDTSDENGVVVLKSELSFVFLSTSFNIILTCENIDHQNSYSLILPIYKECATAATISADPTTTMDESINITLSSNGGPPTTSEFDASGSAVIIVLSVILCIIIAVATAVVLLLLLLRAPWKTPRNDKLTHWKHKDARGEDDIAGSPPIAWETRIQDDSTCTTKDDVQELRPYYHSRRLKNISIQAPTTMSSLVCMSTDKSHATTQEQEDEAYVSDATPPKLDLSVTVESKMVAESETGGASSNIMAAESETGETFPNIQSYTRGIESVAFMYSPPIDDYFIRSLSSMVKEIRDLEESIRQLKEQMEEKNQLLKRKENELEQQKAKLEMRGNEMEQQQKGKLHEQKREFEICPVQVSEAEDSSSVEANMVGNRDRLHVAPTGNLKRLSVPDSGSGHLTEV